VGGNPEAARLKILLLYDYPAGPGGLATQGDLLYAGLREIGVDVCPVHYQATKEKEWYYRWFRPDVAVGVGYWGHLPHLVMHPQSFGIQAVPWLVADGYIANYRETLNNLPLVLVTSNWVKDVYIRDGIRPEIIEVLPVGCNTDEFIPRSHDDPKVAAVRQTFGMQAGQLMILTVGGDGASKGAREVMEALAHMYTDQHPEAPQEWRYICKVWPQERTRRQNLLDHELAEHLGISDHVVYSTDRISREFMPYLFAACDIYAAPSRLEGFGMPQVEAGACGKPVISLAAMGMLDTLVHNETALLARVAEEHYIHETVLGPESGYPEGRRIEFNPPRIADYRADVNDLRRFLEELIAHPELRNKLGAAGRKRVVEHFDYRKVAQRFVDIVRRRLEIH
jgi:glycosyltransferase involved in cell wall biosynthesis